MELQTEVIDRQEKRFTAGLILMALLLLVAFFIYGLLRKNQRAKRLIADQNLTLVNKNAEIQAMNDQHENLLHLVVHDLRSPLNKIEGLVTILKLEGALTSNQLQLVQMLEDVTRKGKSFISEFLEKSQIEYRSKQPNKQQFNLRELLEEIQREYTPQASNKEIQLQYDFKLPQQPAYSDKGLLYHIIINLLSNAIKYSPTGKQIYLKAWNQGKALHFCIKDEGQGFSERDKQSLFKKFQKLSAQPIGAESSIGLGLFLTKTLVDALKGKIELESEAGKGASFTLTFYEVFN